MHSRRRLTIWLDEDVLTTLRAHAKEERVPLAWLIRHHLRQTVRQAVGK